MSEMISGTGSGRATHAYITRWPCGHIASAAIDIPACAQDVAEWIKEGHAVERVPVEYVRENYSKDCAKCMAGEASKRNG